MNLMDFVNYPVVKIHQNNLITIIDRYFASLHLFQHTKFLQFRYTTNIETKATSFPLPSPLYARREIWPTLLSKYKSKSALCSRDLLTH